MISWIIYNSVVGEDLPISEYVEAPTDATAEQLDRAWDTKVDTLSDEEYDEVHADCEIYTLVDMPGVRVWYEINNRRGMDVTNISAAFMRS